MTYLIHLLQCGEASFLIAWCLVFKFCWDFPWKKLFQSCFYFIDICHFQQNIAGMLVAWSFLKQVNSAFYLLFIQLVWARSWWAIVIPSTSIVCHCQLSTIACHDNSSWTTRQIWCCDVDKSFPWKNFFNSCTKNFILFRTRFDGNQREKLLKNLFCGILLMIWMKSYFLFVILSTLGHQGSFVQI